MLSDQAWKVQSDLKRIIRRVASAAGKGVGKQHISVQLELMTPCKPMLAEACKTYDKAIKKCPNGMYAGIKYDGERIQVHYDGSVNKWAFFSRSLLPMAPHKGTFSPIRVTFLFLSLNCTRCS